MGEEVGGLSERRAEGVGRSENQLLWEVIEQEGGGAVCRRGTRLWGHFGVVEQ